MSQALLEEIERHGEKVEECQRFAKQYINAIKVRPPSGTLLGDPQALIHWSTHKWAGEGKAELTACWCLPTGL